MESERTIPSMVDASPTTASLVSNLTNSQVSIGGATVTNVTEVTNVMNTSNQTEDEEIQRTIDALERWDLAGDGGDSDEEGEEVLDHGEDIFSEEEMFDSALETAMLPEKDGDVKAFLKVTAHGSTEILGEISVDGTHNLNNYGNINLPKPPSDYVAPPCRPDKPSFSDVDNPGNWDRYYFCPKFNKQKMHQLQ